MGIFDRNPSPMSTVFDGSGNIHPILNSGHMSTDLSSGTAYWSAGNMVFGSNGSMGTMLGGANGTPQMFIDGNGGIHPIIGGDGCKTIL